MRVIKVGGRVQGDPRLAGALARAWHDAPASFCLVHGGGETISALQARLGSTPRFVAGRRVTTEKDISVLRLALSGLANKQIVSSLSAEGIPAVGVSGEDGSLITARALNSAVLGRVGMPSSVNGALLRTLLDGGFMPVISPVARDDDERGNALNVNADDAAAEIAAVMKAEELLLVSDVPGVIMDGSKVTSLDASGAMRAIDSGIATDGMATKLRAALDALVRGVPRVRIGGLDMMADGESGTMLVAAGELAMQGEA